MPLKQLQLKAVILKISLIKVVIVVIDFIEIKNSLILSVNKFIEGDKELLAEISDDFDELEGLADEEIELKSHLNALSEALKDGDMQRCSEVISMIRLSYMNVENAYSNVADVMSAVVVKIMDRLRYESAKSHEALKLEEVLIANEKLELGTFMDELHWQQRFNLEKFNRILSLLEAYDDSAPQILRLSFSLYSNVMKKLSHRGNNGDSFSIKNISNQSLSELHEVVGKLEALIQALLIKERE